MAATIAVAPALARADGTAGSTAPTPAPAAPAYVPPTPAGFAVSGRQALSIAEGDPKVAEETASHGRLQEVIQVKDGGGAWQVGFRAGDQEVAQVIVDGATGAITESWTGYQVAWPMARGYEGQFGHELNAPWVWIPMAAIFFAGLFEFRRPWRIVHLDLLVLLSFGVSQYFFNRGDIGVSVPLAYPPLIYLLARALWIGFRGGSPLRPSAPVKWLLIAAVFLFVFRVTLNIADSGVIDVGYAGTIGADKITHGEPIYGEGEFPEDNPFGDTYGPFNYYAYVPFELSMPWSGKWDNLPASHGAALAFDLAAVLGLIAFARRMFGRARGNRLGVILAFAWLAYPYTDFALQSNSNDGLVAALVIWSLALFARPVLRGVTLALATAAKFAPLILAPLFAAGPRGLSPRNLRLPVLFSAAFVAVIALMLIEPLIDPGLGTFWDRTLASQLDRTSPFSVWGQLAGVEWLQRTVLGLAALLAIAVAFVPRRRSVVQVAALAAAVLIALQLAVDHWFYLYIPWFAGPLLIALAASRPGYTPATAQTHFPGALMETPDEALTDEPAEDTEFDELPDDDEFSDEDLAPDEGDDTGDDPEGGATGGGDTAETPVSGDRGP
ncbi:MAG: glycosyltransferase family 87 protein [Solirubrobacterales bacterium]